MKYINFTVFFLLPGIVLAIFAQFLLNPVPAYASAHQIQAKQTAHDACDDAGIKPGTGVYRLCEQELPQMCEEATAPIAGCYAQEPLSVRCENPEPQDLEACMTQNVPYDSSNYMLPSHMLENPLGTTLDNNGKDQYNVPFFVITPTNVTIDNQIIQNIWRTILGIVDVAAVILLMLNGLSLIFVGTTFRQADVIERLPAILLALIVANASMGFMHFFVGLNNTMSGDLYTWADSTLQKTLAGYRRPESAYDYAQPTYIIALRKGDNEHNAVALSISQHVKQPSPYSEYKAQTYMNNTEMALNLAELPQQPLNKNYQVGPGYSCNAPNKLGFFAAERLDGGIGGDGQVKSAFQAAHITADPQKYYDAHRAEILGYHTTITYHCSMDITLEQKYIPFYPQHISFQIDLIQLFTSGLNQAIVPLVISVLGAILYAQVLVRLLLLNFYVIISPLAIACWALPGKSGQRLTQMWLSGFLSLVMVQFLQVVTLIMTQVMIGAYLGLFHQQLGNEIGPDLLEEVLGIATLWFTLLIPNLLGTAPMQMLVEAGQEMGRVANAAMFANMAANQGYIQMGTAAANTVLRMFV